MKGKITNISKRTGRLYPPSNPPKEKLVFKMQTNPDGEKEKSIWCGFIWVDIGGGISRKEPYFKQYI